jgi:hypothetical protein
MENEMFYIVDITNNKIKSKHTERSRANYVLTDCYAPDPVNKYRVMDDKELDEFRKGKAKKWVA